MAQKITAAAGFDCCCEVGHCGIMPAGNQVKVRKGLTDADDIFKMHKEDRLGSRQVSEFINISCHADTHGCVIAPCIVFSHFFFMLTAPAPLPTVRTLAYSCND